MKRACKLTRAEYLAANSISRHKPWEAEGISRRTWYRRRSTSATCAGGGTGGTGDTCDACTDAHRSLGGTSPLKTKYLKHFKYSRLNPPPKIRAGHSTGHSRHNINVKAANDNEPDNEPKSLSSKHDELAKDCKNKNESGEPSKSKNESYYERMIREREEISYLIQRLDTDKTVITAEKNDKGDFILRAKQKRKNNKKTHESINTLASLGRLHELTVKKTWVSHWKKSHWKKSHWKKTA
jgi:hypothetical protein